jgi:hypothetical protein
LEKDLSHMQKLKTSRKVFLYQTKQILCKNKSEEIKKITTYQKREQSSKKITILNIYAPNIGTPTFIKQILLSLKEQTGPDTMIVGKLNSPFFSIDRTSRPKKNQQRYPRTVQCCGQIVLNRHLWNISSMTQITNFSQ